MFWVKLNNTGLFDGLLIWNSYKTWGSKPAADLSESVQGEDVLHRQDAAQVFFDGRLAVSRLVAVGAGGQAGQHLPVLGAVDVLRQQEGQVLETRWDWTAALDRIVAPAASWVSSNVRYVVAGAPDSGC